MCSESHTLALQWRITIITRQLCNCYHEANSLDIYSLARGRNKMVQASTRAKSINHPRYGMRMATHLNQTVHHTFLTTSTVMTTITNTICFTPTSLHCSWLHILKIKYGNVCLFATPLRKTVTVKHEIKYNEMHPRSSTSTKRVQNQRMPTHYTKSNPMGAATARNKFDLRQSVLCCVRQGGR